MTLAGTVAADGRRLGGGLFKLQTLAATRTEATFSIALDAREPYLDDHRPGGAPLFSTVMAIEASVTGARALEPGTAQASVTQVHVHQPFILMEKQPHAIELHVVRHPDHAGGFHCTLSSRHHGQVVTHLHAVIRFDAATPRAAFAPARALPFPLPGPVVQGTKVYELFFHGPSFQVVGEAQYHAGQMLCRLNQSLPPYHRQNGAVSHMTPRLIEFALQTAGLLEVAVNGRMKIPDFIGSIERCPPMDTPAPGDVFAKASYGCPDEAYTNIDIVDRSDRLILHVVEYRTVVLPFTVSGDALVGLRAQFLG